MLWAVALAFIRVRSDFSYIQNKTKKNTLLITRKIKIYTLVSYNDMKKNDGHIFIIAASK